MNQINFVLKKVPKFQQKNHIPHKLREEVEEIFEVWSLQFSARLWRKVSPKIAIDLDNPFVTF